MNEPVISVRLATLKRFNAELSGIQVLDHLPSMGMVELPYLAFEVCSVASVIDHNKAKDLYTIAYTAQLVTTPHAPSAGAGDVDTRSNEIAQAMLAKLDLSADDLSIRKQRLHDMRVALIIEKDGQSELKVSRLVWHFEVY